MVTPGLDYCSQENYLILISKVLLSGKKIQRSLFLKVFVLFRSTFIKTGSNYIVVFPNTAYTLISVYSHRSAI